MDFVQILNIIGLLAGAIATLYSAWKYILLPVLRFCRRLLFLVDSIESIMSELQPNGGTSLRDAINRIEIGLILEQNARRAAAMVMDVGIWECDSQGQCLWGNKKWLEMTGLHTEQARGFGWVNGIHIDDREKVLAEWNAAVSQRRVFTMNVRYTMRPALVYAVPALKANGELLGYIGVSTPTER